MTTFYRLKENGKILDYAEFDIATETTTQMVTRYETKEVVEQEKVYDENGEYVLQDVVKTIEVPYEVEETITIDHVPAFIREQYIETERKIIKLTDGSFAFEDEVNLVEEAKRKAEKEFNEAKQTKLTKVDQWTASKITNGFVSTCYNGENILYDTDTETQLTITKARANCEGERFSQAFPNGMGVRGYAQTGTDADGTMVFANTKTVYKFLPEHIIAWDEDFSLHLAKCKYEGWIMQDKVNNATTKEALEAIVLE
jgi:RNase H-fold protein (predicted Holliday junction resolvase)